MVIDIRDRRFQQPQFTPYNPLTAVPRTPRPNTGEGFKRVETPKMKDPDAEDEGSQWGRGLGFVINNPVTQGLLRPLEVLDYGRRAAMLGIEESVTEGADIGLLNPFSLIVDKERSDADTRSNLEKLRDPSYGFGQFAKQIDTSNDTFDKWANRGVGLVGDVAFDPLSYVGGIGLATKAGAAGGRTAKAAGMWRALNQARKEGRVTDEFLQGLEDVGRRGFGASDQIAADAGVQGGVRIAANPLSPYRGPQYTIPGSARVTNKLSEARGAIGQQVAKSKTGRRIMDIRTPEPVEKAYQRIFYGEGDVPLDVALETVALYRGAKRNQGLLRPVQAQADRLVHDARRMDDATKKQVVDTLESKKPTTGVAKQYQEVLDKAWKFVTDQGMPLKYRKNYAPHISSRQAMEWRKDPTNSGRIKAPEGFFTEAMYDESGVTMARKLEVGDEFEINGVPIKLKEGTISEFNEKARAAGLDFDFFETDPGIIVQKYLNMLSDDFAIWKTVPELISETGGMGRFKNADEILTAKHTRRFRRGAGTKAADDDLDWLFSELGVDVADASPYKAVVDKEATENVNRFINRNMKRTHEETKQQISNLRAELGLRLNQVSKGKAEWPGAPALRDIVNQRVKEAKELGKQVRQMMKDRDQLPVTIDKLTGDYAFFDELVVEMGEEVRQLDDLIRELDDQAVREFSAGLRAQRRDVANELVKTRLRMEEIRKQVEANAEYLGNFDDVIAQRRASLYEQYDVPLPETRQPVEFPDYEPTVPRPDTTPAGGRATPAGHVVAAKYADVATRMESGQGFKKALKELSDMTGTPVDELEADLRRRLGQTRPAEIEGLEQQIMKGLKEGANVDALLRKHARMYGGTPDASRERLVRRGLNEELDRPATVVDEITPAEVTPPVKPKVKPVYNKSTVRKTANEVRAEVREAALKEVQNRTGRPRSGDGFATGTWRGRPMIPRGGGEYEQLRSKAVWDRLFKEGWVARPVAKKWTNMKSKWTGSPPDLFAREFTGNPDLSIEEALDEYFTMIERMWDTKTPDTQTVVELAAQRLDLPEDLIRIALDGTADEFGAAIRTSIDEGLVWVDELVGQVEPSVREAILDEMTKVMTTGADADALEELLEGLLGENFNAVMRELTPGQVGIEDVVKYTISRRGATGEAAIPRRVTARVAAADVPEMAAAAPSRAAGQAKVVEARKRIRDIESKVASAERRLPEVERQIEVISKNMPIDDRRALEAELATMRQLAADLMHEMDDPADIARIQREMAKWQSADTYLDHYDELVNTRNRLQVQLDEGPREIDRLQGELEPLMGELAETRPVRPQSQPPRGVDPLDVRRGQMEREPTRIDAPIRTSERQRARDMTPNLPGNERTAAADEVAEVGRRTPPASVQQSVAELTRRIDDLDAAIASRRGRLVNLPEDPDRLTGIVGDYNELVSERNRLQGQLRRLQRNTGPAEPIARGGQRSPIGEYTEIAEGRRRPEVQNPAEREALEQQALVAEKKLTDLESAAVRKRRELLNHPDVTAARAVLARSGESGAVSRTVGIVLPERPGTYKRPGRYANRTRELPPEVQEWSRQVDEIVDAIPIRGSAPGQGPSRYKAADRYRQTVKRVADEIGLDKARADVDKARSELADIRGSLDRKVPVGDDPETMARLSAELAKVFDPGEAQTIRDLERQRTQAVRAVNEENLGLQTEYDTLNQQLGEQAPQVAEAQADIGEQLAEVIRNPEAREAVRREAGTGEGQALRPAREDLEAQREQAQRWQDRSNTSKIKTLGSLDDATEAMVTLEAGLADISQRHIDAAKEAGKWKGTLARVGKLDPKKRGNQEVESFLEGVLKDDPGLSDVDNQAVAFALTKAEETAEKIKPLLVELERTGVSARADEAGRVVDVVLNDLTHSYYMPELFGPGGPIVDNEMLQFMQNVRQVSKEPRFWKYIDNMTGLFKTYAVLSPGFHVRNSMSGAFNNAADNVGLADMGRAVTLMRQYGKAVKDGNVEQWLAKQADTVLNAETGATVADALDAVAGTGVGGRYREHGVGDRTQARWKFNERLYENTATYFLGKKPGTFVESSLRLPVALDSLRKGDSVSLAVDRINRLHFDYSDVSRFDQSARRLIPFWTFMSRNLPLQVAQFYTKPRAYAKYASLKRNLTGENPEGTPDYFEDVGAFRLGDETLGGLPLFLQPDLAHTRIEEDVARYTNFQDPAQIMSDFNPLFSAPMEYAFGKDVYTGRTYQDDDVREAGLVEKPIEVLARLLGVAETTPQGNVAVPEKLFAGVRSVLPVYDRLSRLFPQAVNNGNDPDTQARQLESMARFAGLPIRTLSPQQQRSTMRSEYYDRFDDLDLQRALRMIDANK